MAVFNKYYTFAKDVSSGVHQLQTGTSHVFKVALSNTAPSASTHAVRADIAELATANGYTAGGVSIGTITGAAVSGLFTFKGGTDPTWTATSTGFTFRYAILYNDTPTSPVDPLIGWWDYGVSIALRAGEVFLLDIDQTNGIFTLS